MIVKKHKTRDGRLIIAVCDSNLIGKKLIDNKKQLDISSDFYKGDEMSGNDIKKFLKFAYIINLVGENSVEFGIKEGIIKKENVSKVGGVPHAECMVIMED